MAEIRKIIPSYRHAGLMGVYYWLHQPNQIVEFCRVCMPSAPHYDLGEQFRSLCFWLGVEGE